MALYVCDPVCVQAFGHNVPALSYFAHAFRDHFPHSVALCCTGLPSHTAAAKGFVPHYRYYYRRYMPVPGVADPEIEADSDAGYRYADPLEAVATQDARRLLTRFRIGADDALLFPSLDFYGVAGLLNALEDVPAAHQPRVFLRFIGVMEHASHRYRDPSTELLSRLRRSLAAGHRIALSAETPRLADALAITLRSVVTVTPYPGVAEATDVPEDGPFVCFCPGSSRFDKGFLHLHALFSSVRQHDPELRIRFVVQDLPARDAANHQDYVSRLYSIPGLKLLPTQIEDEEMHQRYLACSLVVLPYDARTYQFRGSAAMMEAVCHGRPVVTLEGCAFSEQVRYFNIGEVAADIDAMAQTIVRAARVEPEQATARARQARHRFIGESMAAYERWFRSEP